MDKARAGYKEGLVAIIVNTGLFGIKLWAGMVSGSVALIADAWHTISDSLSSFIVIIGSRLASEKPDKNHPFGHGRWEPITAIFIGFFLAVIAYNFIRDSIERFQEGQAAEFGMIAIVVTAISLLVKSGLARYAFNMARKSGNSAVKADGWHHQSDAFTSGLILAGIFIADRFWWIDSVLGGLVSLLLLYAVFEIMKEAVNKLLGERPDPELIHQIESLIERLYPEGVLPHHYHLHNYVDHRELTFHIKVQDNLDVHTGHLIATHIENRISEELHITATIHVEPENHDHDSD